MASLKRLAVVLICFALVVVVGSQSKRWVAYRLTQDFAALSLEEKQVRLAQLAGLEHFGVHWLVQALATEEDRVARTAYDLLDQQLSQSASFSDHENLRRHRAMVDALESFAVHMPDQRTGWATALLQRTRVAAVDGTDPAVQNLLRRASDTIELLALSERSGPSILDSQPLDENQPRRLQVRTPGRAISISSDSRATFESTSYASAEAAVPPPRIVAKASSQPELQPAPAPSRAPDSPANLALSEPVLLRGVRSPSSDATSSIHSVTQLVDSPLSTYDDRSVMHWLGSPHQVMREKARTELLIRGFAEAQIALAAQIAAGDVPTRLALVDAISRSPEIDPRPWLYLMLDDASREVKLRVVSVLATMNDPGVVRHLRSHLRDENDASVASLIEQTLQRR